ncbi:MAG: hypothetical protein KGS72_17660 [Cyanobacteria bacterium REEB67]|nr:hypothetical protein [Cyanobacteria bacterium REEB67]
MLNPNNSIAATCCSLRDADCCDGIDKISRSHAPDPDVMQGKGRHQPTALILNSADGERILKDFSLHYVGIAHGIVKAELEKVDDSHQRIIAFVTDWNGIVNIPANYQGLSVTFTQYIPPGAVFQL